MRWLGLVNIFLVGTILLVGALFFFSGQTEIYPPSIPRAVSKELPKSPFADSEEFFQGIGEGIVNLTWVPPQMQLPDLRQELQFCGKNARPDASLEGAYFHVSLKGSGERACVREGERTYLVYQGHYSSKALRQLPAREPLATAITPLWGEASIEESESHSYVFSPGNQPTPLWFEVKSTNENTLEVRVSILDEKGALVSSPKELRSFHIQAQEFPKTQVFGWDLGKYRVDTTLLVRQKARWMGPDLFLEIHGGDEFAHAIGKEKIDFLDGDSAYSCFIGPGDFLVWKKDRWEVPRKNENTQSLPLLVVKKIEEKIMSLELWDPEGRGKLLLSLIRCKDHTRPPNLAQEMKFVGAKTWAQFIVECRMGGRMTLKLHDWLVLTQDGWTKLDSPEQVDAYVNQTITGPLFILDKMNKQNGHQILVGHLFNASRTEVEVVELSTSPPNTPLANFYHHTLIAPPIQPRFSQNTLEGD